MERLDVAEQILSGFPSRVVGEVMNTFRFERSQEALHGQVVVPGAGAAVLHFNADEPDTLEYDMSFKKVTEDAL